MMGLMMNGVAYIYIYIYKSLVKRALGYKEGVM